MNRDLVEALRQAWGPKSWHGTGLRGSLRGVTPDTALWRPAPGRHNIWELVLHLAYWKYTVIRRLTGAPRGSFPRKQSNWIPVGETTASAWRADIQLLHTQHETLIEVVAAFPPSRLSQKRGSRWTHREMILGVASHDAYHTGQIQLLKRLNRTA